MSKEKQPTTSKDWNPPAEGSGLGFEEAAHKLDGAAAAGFASHDLRFAELTALVRAFSAIPDDHGRAQVLALARSLAGEATKK